MTSTIFQKGSDHWIYHKNTIETHDDEKANPGEKLWLIARFMMRDQEHELEPGKGLEVFIGDTVKFGRVRYKIVMLHSQKHGLKVYDMHNRFVAH